MEQKFRIVIWGLGTNGKNLIDVLDEENVLAIIDSNKEKQGLGFYHNIPIIDFKTYKNMYSDYFIVVSPMKYTDIEEFLVNNQINKFLILNKSAVRMSAFLGIKKHTFISTYKLKKDRKYFINGVNLFSINLYHYLSNQSFNVEFIAFTKRQSVALDILTQEHVIEKYCQKDILDDKNVCLIETENNNNYRIINGIDVISCELLNADLYLEWKKDLLRFKNIHAGERVFVVATGPSIRVEDLEKLAKYEEKTISMNSIYYIFANTEWRPDYYVVSDGLAIREYESCENREKLFHGIEKFISDNYLKFWENKLDNSYHGYRQEQNVNEILFSEDFSKVVYSGLTVVYACLQLAVYMGFKEIFLLGCDFSFSKDFNSPNDHFYHNVEGFYTFDYDSVQRGYEKAKEYALIHGIKIYNATRGGKLEVFERVDFDSLF